MFLLMRVRLTAVYTGLILIAAGSPAFGKQKCSDLACPTSYRANLTRLYISVYFPKNLRFADECGLEKDGAGGYIYAYDAYGDVNRSSIANFRAGPGTKYKVLFEDAVGIAEVYAYRNGWFLVGSETGVKDGIGWVHGSNLLLPPSKKGRTCLGIPADFPLAK